MTGQAVVTGAARGIGRAIAERLGRAGFLVVLVDLNPDVAKAARELEEQGLPARPVQADLAAEAGRRAVTEAVRAVGQPLGVLVNNAGITRDALLLDMEEDAFLQVIRVNLGAPYELTRALVPLLAKGGSVVNVASRAYLGNVGQFNYTTAKGGLVGMTRALALELAPRVRVNAVAPGLTATEMSKAIPDRIQAKLVGSIPLGRMAEPSEIAEVVAFLASPAASYVTGQVLLACGGRSLGA